MRNDPQGRAIQIGRYLNAPTVLNVGTVSTSVSLNQNRHTTLAAVVGSGTGVLFVSEIDTQGA